MKIEIKNRWSGEVILCGKYKSIKDCLEKNRNADLRGADLRGADLRGADLGGADLRGADLRGADLGDADLGGAKNYSESHDIFMELVRRKQCKVFTDKEWAMIGRITIHRLCWGTIKNKFGKKMLSVFKKLAKDGFNEYLDKYNKVLNYGGLDGRILRRLWGYKCTLNKNEGIRKGLDEQIQRL